MRDGSARYRLVLLRHGESEWNARDLFTGWVDVGLSADGERAASCAGMLLAAHALPPVVVHTSVQRRAIRTAELPWPAAEGLDSGAPVVATQFQSLRRAAGQEQG